MGTHNIQFHDKFRKNSLIFVFLSYRKNFVGTKKRVRISHGKRAIEPPRFDCIHLFLNPYSANRSFFFRKKEKQISLEISCESSASRRFT